MGTVIPLLECGGGNGRAVMMVTRAGCAARTHRDLCILRRESSTTERYCQLRLIGDGVRCNQQPPLDPRSLSSELRMVISSARAVCIPDAKMPEIILSNLGHAIALESVVT
jgi:hypothetical protein